MKRLILTYGLLLSILCYPQKDSLKVKDLLDIAYSLERTHMDSAISTYAKASKLATEIGYWIGAGRATSYTGIVYSDYGFNDSAIVYHKKSIPYYEKAEYKDGVASSLINLGNAYQFKGDYDNSTEYYLKGIEAYEAMNDTVRLIFAYGNFASLFTDLKMFVRSKEYQSKALEFSYKVGDTVSVGYLLNDLGLTNLSLGESDNALTKFIEALEIAQTLNNDELKYFSNKNLYNYYFEKGIFDLAYDYALKSYKNAVDIKKPYYECYALNSLGLSHFKLNRQDSALFYINKSIETANRIGAKEHLMEAYYAQNQVFAKMNRFEEAYSSLQQFQLLQDSIVGKQKQEYISKLEQQYRVKQKDNEILAQQLTIEKNEALLQKKINQNVFYLIGSLLLLFLLFTLWYRQRQKQKLNAQSIETLKKQQEVKSLAALIEGEDKERSRIAKDLHDSVNGSLSAIKHNLSSIPENVLSTEEQNTLKSAMEMIDQTCEDVRNISHDLVPPSLLNYGLIEATEQYCNRITTSNDLNIEFHHYGKSIDLPKKIETTIYHIVQELVNNAVKHAMAKNAMVQINSDKQSMHITIEDDGIGYDSKIVSHGLGLNNIRSRIEFLKADMNVRSDDQGTSVVIDIDFNKIPRL